jgi:bisphosphoglycerate-independent phosphoglycerate mutase (AlkP superfamily)
LVPAIITKKDLTITSGGLSDIAPTILKIMSITQPPSMTGKPLI